MQRREFLQAGLLSAASALACCFPMFLPVTGIGAQTPPVPPLRAEPFLALCGGPFRKSCDGLADYSVAPFESVARDILHHRLPAKWREELVLGLPPSARRR